MPIAEMNRREEGSPSVVADLEQFKKNWAIFSEGTLVQLIDWEVHQEILSFPGL